jgi:hypothetical protein
LVALAGARVVVGFSGAVMGPLDVVPRPARKRAAAKGASKTTTQGRAR